MSKQFFYHINKFIDINDSEFENIMSYFEHRSLDKKEIISESGSKSTYNFFVLKGCLQMYSVSNDGVERTLQFALENWWITDCLSFMNQSESDFFIQSVEQTQILCITFENQEILLTKYPQMERYFRIIYQIAYGASLMKMKYLYDFSKEDRYFHFIEKYPEFAQRVPQYLLASYLGLTPEYVSGIRRKRRS